MTLNEPEIVTLGEAENLIQEIICLWNTEGMPDGFWPAFQFREIYIVEPEQ